MSTEDVEAGMPPFHEHINKVFGDLGLGKEHLENLMAKYGLQVLQLKQWGHAEHTATVETSVRTQNMQVMVPSQEVTERMNGHNRSRNGVLLRNRNDLLEKFLQGLPRAVA